MTRVELYVAASVVLAAFNLSPAVAATSPLAKYDGLWSVQILTEQGMCDRGYRYPVMIKSGKVMHAPNVGDASFVIEGQVARRGAVRVAVSRGSQRADGTGVLDARYGSGTWQSPAGCSGRWTAERRS